MTALAFVLAIFASLVGVVAFIIAWVLFAAWCVGEFLKHEGRE